MLTINTNTIEVIINDITKLNVDYMVNAANKSLRGGGGVDGAIHRAAGNKLLKYIIDNIPQGCETTDAILTPGFNLNCKIIHAVGPYGVKPELLKRTYLNCLKYVENEKNKTIAFPCISTGIYHYPNELACPVVLQTIKEWCNNNPNNIHIIICTYLQKDYETYLNNIQNII